MRAISAELFKRVGGAGSNRRLASPDRRFSGPAAGATTSPGTARTPKPEAWQHSALEPRLYVSPLVLRLAASHTSSQAAVFAGIPSLVEPPGPVWSLWKEAVVSGLTKYAIAIIRLVSSTTVQFRRRQARSSIIRDMTSSSMPQGSSQRRRQTRIRRASQSASYWQSRA